MPRTDSLTAPSQQKESLSFSCSSRSLDEFHCTKFNHVQSPEPVTDQSCSWDCHDLGHGPTSGASSEVLLPGCQAIIAGQEKILSVTLYLCIIHLFIFAEMNWGLVLCWKLGIKSWITSVCPSWYSWRVSNFMMNFLHWHPPAEQGIPSWCSCFSQ